MPIYERRGGDVLVNSTTANHQDNARIAYLADGRFVVAWRDWSATGGDTSGQAIRARIFNADGTAATGEFLANTMTEGYQKGTVLFSLASGGFAIAWTDTRLDGSDSNVIVQIFDAAGAKVGGEIPVNSHLAGEQSAAAGTALADGGFVLTWTDHTAEPAVSGTGNSPIGVRAQRFDAAGAKVGGELAVNTATLYEQSEPGVAALAGGGWVIVWKDLGSLNGIVGQRFAADGSRVGGEFMVSTVIASTQTGATVAALAAGGFVVAWTDFSQIGGDTSYSGVKAQLFDAAGARVGGEFLVNTATSGYQQYAFVTAMPTGGFLVTWSSTTTTTSGDGSGSAVKGQYFDAAGAREGGEFLVNAAMTNDQLGAGAAVGADAVTAVYVDFSGTGGDSSGSAVKFTRFIIAPGTEGDDTLDGTAAEDTINGFGGNDVINGLDGRDTLNGGAGDDVIDGGEGGGTLSGEGGDDRLTGGGGADLLSGGTGIDILVAGGGNDLLEGGDGADELDGGAGLDVLAGEGGDDILSGGGDEDLLLGGEGADTLRGDDGDDDLNGETGSDGVYGGAGVDYLYGTALAGSADVDELHGGADSDRMLITFAAAAGGVTSTRSADPDGGFAGTLTSGGQLRFVYSGIEQFFVSGTDSADILIGGDIDDSLAGHGGDDSLTGDGGADSLTGGAGRDLMTGGAGNDTYDVDDPGDTVVEQADGGIDLVQTSLAAYTLGDHVEELRGLTGGGHVLTGNALANRLIGGAGADTLDGRAGADAMTGGAGNDVYVIDDAGDTTVDSAGVDEIRTDLAAFSLAGHAAVENLTGTAAAAQSLTGNGLANTLRAGGLDDSLYGGDAADQLFGGAGNDLLDGGTGLDVMTGGSGDDVYLVDDPSDRTIEEAGGGIDEVRLIGAGWFVLPEHVENGTGLGSGWHSIQGNAADNVLRGDDASHDWLDGGAGTDTLIGGRGSDTYVIDSLDDAIVETEDLLPPDYVSEGSGDSVVTSLADYTLRADLENLRGTTAQQRLVGTDRGNAMASGGGQDTLIGGKGDDQYSIYEGDTIVELDGEGNDTVYVNYGNFILSDTLERLSGQYSGGQVLTGNRFANYVDASSGNDTLDGGGGADQLEGGRGNDTYYVDDAGDVVAEQASEGSDEVRTALASYTLPTNVEKFTGLAAAGQSVRGNILANTMTGGGGGDLFRLDDGGNDIVAGQGGNDAFVFGKQLTPLDQVNGGEGKDQLGLQGNYNLVLGSQNLVGVETLALLPGSDARFGDTSGALYSYNLTTVDANIEGVKLLNVNYNTLRAGENVVFNGSAEINGAFFFFAGLGADQLRGGAGGDGFFFGTGRFTAADRIDGGPGADQVGLRGDYAAGVTLQAASLVNVETLAFLSAADTRFGGAGTGFGYFVTSHDGNVAAGQRLSVNGAQLMAGESMRFDGRPELDGSFRILAGKGDDILVGGAQADFVYGNFGKDVLEGRGGADTFFYRAAGESAGLGFDQLVGFDPRVDRIDLPSPTTFVGYTGATVRQSSFDADLAAALQTLGAGQGRIVNVQAGDMAGRMFAVADGNGAAGYQAGQDYVIELVSPAVMPIAGDPFFI